MKKKTETFQFNEKDLDRKIMSGEIIPVHLPKIVSICDVIKYQFCSEIIRFKKEKNLQQKDLVALIDVNKSEVSRLCSYNLKEFSQERLVHFVEILISKGADIDLNLVWDKIKLQSKKVQKNLIKHREIGQELRS